MLLKKIKVLLPSADQCTFHDKEIIKKFKHVRIHHCISLGK